MTILNGSRLRRHLSNPTWSPEQEEEADDLLAELEEALESRLEAPITPVGPRTEVAAMLDTGLVLTSRPVFSVSAIDDVDTTAGLPADWEISNGHLVRIGGTYGLTSSALGPAYVIEQHRSGALGSVRLTYMAGWGDRPALRHALLKKARAIWINRHDDTVTARDLDASAPPGPVPEAWTEDDLAEVSFFKWRTAWR